MPNTRRLQSFEGREVRDTATGVPDDYVAPPAFANLALQHTNVKLTWDADDDNRKRTLAKRVTKDELRDDDFKVTRPLCASHVILRVAERP